MTRAIRALGVFALAALAAGFTPLPNFLAVRLQPSPVYRPADGVVILGGDANRDGTPGNESTIRLVEGVRLFRHGLAPQLVLSGSARDVAARHALARDLGVPDAALINVAGARNTRDEARLVAERLGPGATVLLVTSGQHLRRAARMFQREGLTVFPAPANVVEAISGRPADRFLLMRDIAEQLAASVYNSIVESL